MHAHNFNDFDRQSLLARSCAEPSERRPVDIGSLFGSARGSTLMSPHADHCPYRSLLGFYNAPRLISYLKRGVSQQAVHASASRRKEPLDAEAETDSLPTTAA